VAPPLSRSGRWYPEGVSVGFFNLLASKGRQGSPFNAAHAKVAELADAPDLGSVLADSEPPRTKPQYQATPLILKYLITPILRTTPHQPALSYRRDGH
jgi:hypothetical protein